MQGGGKCTAPPGSAVPVRSDTGLTGVFLGGQMGKMAMVQPYFADLSWDGSC